MRIGLDVDGCLANFNYDYQQRIIGMTGHNFFQPCDQENPPTWNYPELRGYTKDEMEKVWKYIQTSDDFFEKLLPLDGATSLDLVMPGLEDHHDIYFITNRPGITAKRQTERWLFHWLNYGLTPYTPTVLIAEDKGSIVEGLKLDVYLDDKWENAFEAGFARPKCHVYLLDRPYNRIVNAVQSLFTRVSSVQEMLDLELKNL